MSEVNGKTNFAHQADKRTKIVYDDGVIFFIVTNDFLKPSHSVLKNGKQCNQKNFKLVVNVSLLKFGALKMEKIVQLSR